MTDGLAQGILEALPEPAFLLTADGDIVSANRAALNLLGPEASRGPLAAWLAKAPDGLDRYLGRVRATNGALPGALVFRTREGNLRYRVHCKRLSGARAEVRLLLRCSDARKDQFSVLAERVRQLDEELRQRIREKAVLREALEENRTLMRELQHRVKNNIQMMISLLTMSAASHGSGEARGLLDAAKDRIRALATAQDLIYETQTESAVPAPALFGALAGAIEASAEGVSVELDVAPVSLPQEHAHCLALIVNELITNSIKHGLKGGAGTVQLQLAQANGELRLVIRDGGEGYPPLDSVPRTSGLTLVRGLCRQIGAAVEFGNDRGAKSVVVLGDLSPAAFGDPPTDVRSGAVPSEA